MTPPSEPPQVPDLGLLDPVDPLVGNTIATSGWTHPKLTAPICVAYLGR